MDLFVRERGLYLPLFGALLQNVVLKLPEADAAVVVIVHGIKGSHDTEAKGSHENDTAEVTSLNHLWTGLAAEDDTTAGATMMMKGMGDSMGPDTRTMGVTTMSTNDTMHLVGKTPLLDARKKKERRRSMSTPDMLQGLWRESESDDDEILRFLVEDGIKASDWSCCCCC